MKYNFIYLKLKDKTNINLSNNKILELFKLSIGNNINILDYNQSKKEPPNQNIEISYFKKYIKSNIGKMIYKNIGNNKETKIFNKKFISNNKKRAKIIINNKLYELKENLDNKNIFAQTIKIKFFDYIFYLNCMFQDCESLFSVKNFQNINTKHLKTIYSLFERCNSLIYIDDISNWNMNKINNICHLFYQCSSLKELPDISKWKLNNINNISFLFFECTSLKLLPDISKWNISNANDISGMFCKCSSLETMPDISKWDTNQIINMSFLFCGCLK